jgi:GT2 family glycosyltransferase
MKKTAVILVNWNGYHDTLACVESLLKLNINPNLFEVIVVDNGSTNESVKILSTKFPKLTILETKQNLGFSGGNNVGIKYALDRKYDYVWLLNNDTFVDKNALSSMLNELDKYPNCIVGSKIYFAPGHEFHYDKYQLSERGKVIWYAGGIIDWDNMYGFHKGVDKIDTGQFEQAEDTDFITGCSMMIPNYVIQTVGLLDEKLFIYLEDLDYCIRAKKFGFRLRFIPKSVLWHINAGSTAKPGNELHEYYLTRNRLVVGLRYAPLRTKIALIKEASLNLINCKPVKRKAIFDAILGKLGGRYLWKK